MQQDFKEIWMNILIFDRNVRENSEILEDPAFGYKSM